jgi:hypothetical protein
MAWIELHVKLGPAPNAVELTWINLDQVPKIVFVEDIPNVSPCALVFLFSNDAKDTLLTNDPDDIRLLKVHLLGNKA